MEFAQLTAFDNLKELPTSTPVLAIPRSEGLFILDTDACTVHAGSTLLQQQPHKSILPVGYYSRGLNLSVHNFSTTEREFLDAVWACVLLRRYLEGKEFLIQTDHSCLGWLLSMDAARRRAARWRLRLSELRYKVCPRPGT